MAKKRKTRKEKIIVQLKRELEKQKLKTAPLGTKTKVSQEVVSQKSQAEISKPKGLKKADNSAFSYDPRLVKKDLTKTLTLALVAISLEVVLYFYLR